LGIRKAMTIGELLITMTIIGVIAVLVLPGFIKDYHNKVYLTKLKKVYEMVDTAINQACVDSSTSTFAQTKYASGANNQLFINTYFKKASGTNTNPFSSSYKILNTKEDKSAGVTSGDGYAKLAGGEAVSFGCSAGDYCIVHVDVNSLNAPNIAGRDFFVMYIDKTTNEVYDINSSDKCGTDVYGSGCLSKIMEDNWEMKY